MNTNEYQQKKAAGDQSFLLERDGGHCIKILSYVSLIIPANLIF
jgi:hypothetical protein